MKWATVLRDRVDKSQQMIASIANHLDFVADSGNKEHPAIADLTWSA